MFAQHCAVYKTGVGLEPNLLHPGGEKVADDTLQFVTRILSAGFAFRERYSPNVSTEQLAQSLGQPIALTANSPVHALTPKATDEAPSNTYSGNYGLAEFPLHTDMANWFEPPRYLMLRCIVGAPDVATMVVDPRLAVDSIGFEKLTRALMRPRRRVAGRMSLLPIVQPHDDGAILRWDERYFLPASRAGEICATEMSQSLRELPVIPVVLSRPGDTVVIDNWRMLHGRAAVPEGSRSRRIERVYLKALAQ